MPSAWRARPGSPSSNASAWTSHRAFHLAPPLSIAQLAISLYAAEKGFLDELPVAQILPFEKALHAHFASNYGDWVKAANDKADWNDAVEAALKKCCTEFFATL